MERKYKKDKRPIDYVKRKPYMALMEVWDYTNLDCIRDELDEWYALALSHADTGYDMTALRAQFIEFYEELNYLIEAVFYFTSDTDKADLKEEALPPHLRGKENQPRILSLDSVIYSVPCIQDFCSRIPLHYVRIEVWDFFEATACYRGNLEMNVNASRIFRLYLDVMVIVEAAYIISKQATAKNEKK